MYNVFKEYRLQQPFLPHQGASTWGLTDVYYAYNTEIKGPGNIGLSSHHGIHGNNAENIYIHCGDDNKFEIVFELLDDAIKNERKESFVRKAKINYLKGKVLQAKCFEKLIKKYEFNKQQFEKEAPFEFKDGLSINKAATTLLNNNHHIPTTPATKPTHRRGGHDNSNLNDNSNPLEGAISSLLISHGSYKSMDPIMQTKCCLESMNIHSTQTSDFSVDSTTKGCNIGTFKQFKQLTELCINIHVQIIKEYDNNNKKIPIKFTESKRALFNTESKKELLKEYDLDNVINNNNNAFEFKMNVLQQKVIKYDEIYETYISQYSNPIIFNIRFRISSYQKDFNTDILIGI